MPQNGAHEPMLSDLQRRRGMQRTAMSTLQCQVDHRSETGLLGRLKAARPSRAFLQNIVLRTERDNQFTERQQYVTMMVLRNQTIES